MKNKAILCLMLVALTLLPLLAACADSSENPVVSTAAVSTDAPETQDPFYTGVESTNYKEWEFIIAAPQPDDWGQASYDREELTNDSLNDAIYKRNRELEDYFNITISTVPLGSTGTQAEAFMEYKLSGQDIIDLIAVGYYQSGKPLITKEMILPWNDVPHINIKKPWWNDSVSKTLAILGNYYLLVGDVNWYSMKETAVCYFNKQVANTYQNVVGDLYQTVRDHQWTFDRALDISKQISHDNGDNVWDEKDTYGAVQDGIIGTTGFIYAANYHTVRSTADGLILNYHTSRMMDLVNYIYSFCFENNASYTEVSGFLETSKGIPIFFDNRALFMFNSMRHAEAFRGFDADFGIIPYPLYNEEQKEYSTFCDQWGLACGLPSSATDYERTGAILEEMSARSRRLVVPAYYEKTLMGKIKRDDESEEMLNLIFSNVIYDIGICYCTSLDFVVAEYMVRNQSKNLTSWYRRMERRMEDNYSELYDFVKSKVEGEG